ncbi:hypothetical protein GPJ56_000089 [Histomonas meleagridis]|uniref:uncharacterized protein n=1 Tax=Histomonas meleagridis TaxID=135588 RepID=UPI003559C15B|nr:hypothetical protein GPJ56_000089 [Histomonas meleagridis]KAH0805588.1 hypothetical protein GO595_001643 [Histomonas meleagridis]
MDANQTKQFSVFLSKQTSLKNLSVDVYVDVTDLSPALVSFLGVIESMQFASLTLRRDASLHFACGHYFDDRLENKNKETMYDFEFTDRQIFDDILILLALYLNSMKDDIIYMGINASAFETLVTLCNDLISKNLPLSSIPRSQFFRNFDQSHPRSMSIWEHVSVISTSKLSLESNQLPVENNKEDTNSALHELLTNEEIDLITNRGELEDMFEECLEGKVTDEINHDPILDAIEKISEKISFKKLLSLDKIDI